MLALGMKSGDKWVYWVTSCVVALWVMLPASVSLAQSTTPGAVGSNPLAGPQRTREEPAPSGGPTELDGCLTTSDGLMPKLTLFHSNKFYRVETREGLLTEQPLAIAQNVDSLVHLTGHLGPVPDIYDPDHSSVFIIDTITKLAPTCNVSESLAELRKKEHPRARAANVAPAAGVPVEEAAGVPVIEMVGELLVFKPAAIKIKVGQTVEWKNSSAEPHTVTADPHQATNAVDVKLPKGAQPFDSGYLNTGQTFRHTFTMPGIYRYVCTLHEVQGMIGEVIVAP